MNVTVRPELKLMYPRVAFGSLTVKEAPNSKQNKRLEDIKHSLEKNIREEYPAPRDDPVIQVYSDYFKRWNRTYPVEFQVKSIKAGRSLPTVSTLVDCMFMSELRNRILSSGHDLDSISGDAFFDLSDRGDEYTKLNGEKQSLPQSDVVLRDSEGILASVLYGPARRTSISPRTDNAQFFAWCPNGMQDDAILAHLNDIKTNLEIVYGTVKAELTILR
jgi:DNA/RNA-binding domain of Phe-tRNA-synthetase-like protein